MRRGDVARALAADLQVLVLVGPDLSRGEAAALVAPAGAAWEHLVVVMLDQPWWRYVDAARVAQVVLVATEGTAELKQARQAATAAADMGALAHVVLLTAASHQVRHAGDVQGEADAATATNHSTSPSDSSAAGSATESR